MNLFLKTIVINAHDMEKMKNFWTEALGFEVEVASQWFTRLKNPLGESHTKIALQLTDKPKTDRNRLHIDLVTDNGEAEVKRLEALGAKVVPWTYPMENPPWIVMADPEGNEFCVSTVGETERETFKKIYQPS